MTRATDRMGILFWSEIPVYWAEHFGDPAVLQRAEQQLTEEIRRDRDKASIILWSIANETPNTPERTKFLKTLAGDVRVLDSTRLVTAALLVRSEGHIKYVDDTLGEALDVIGANEYIGWYEQSPDGADTTEWKIAYDKPLIISEFGGDAAAGVGADHLLYATAGSLPGRLRRQGLALDQLGDFVAIQDFANQQHFSDGHQGFGVLVDDGFGGVVTALDQFLHLLIDADGGVFGVVAVLGDFAAEEDLLFLLAVAHRSQFAHAPLANHLAGEIELGPM